MSQQVRLTAVHTLQFKNEPPHITLSLRQKGRLVSSKIEQGLSILFPLKNGNLPTNGEPRDLWLHLKLLQPKFKNHWPPGRSPSLLLWPPHYGRGHLPSKFSGVPDSKLQLSTVQQPCFLGHVFLRTYFFLDQRWNHPLCEPGVWLCPLATTGHFRTHCRSPVCIHKPQWGDKAFVLVRIWWEGSPVQPSLKPVTVYGAGLTEEANPNNVQCTTGTRERSLARRGKGKSILEPGQGCELSSLADLRFSNRLWSLEHIRPRAGSSPYLLNEWVLNEVLSISSSANQSCNSFSLAELRGMSKTHTAKNYWHKTW